MNLAQIEEAHALAPIVYHTITAVDKGAWMVVQHVPDLGTGGAAATIAVETGAGTLTFKVDAATPLTLDVVGNTTGLILTATTDTMGEVVDLINQAGAWRAYLLGALRADLPSELLNFTAASCFGDNGKVLYSDNSDSRDISYTVSGEKFVTNGISGHLKDADDEVLNMMLHADITATCASPIVIRYYTGKQGSTEVKMQDDILLTTATRKQQGEVTPNEPWIVANRGERLIIRVQALSATLAPTAPTIHVAGKSVVYKNDRIVDSIAFPA